ncbi:DUF3179 domain-containing (seleno)protein [Haladaptatus sp. NG-SE-30]
MNRRQFLAVVGSSGVAGCFGRPPESETGETTTSTSDTATTNANTTSGSNTTIDSSLAAQGFPATICEEEPPGGFQAVDEPAFASDWSGREISKRYGALSAETVVVGVKNGQEVRAYPLSVLRWHEAVNDTFGGPLLVTYCTICQSGLVADRLVADEPTVFSVTGLLWQAPGLRAGASEQEGKVFGATPKNEPASVRNSGNLVLADETTGSYWSQILAEAICGPRTGDELSIRPSALATWDEWRFEHPKTEVLLPPPHSGTLPK